MTHLTTRLAHSLAARLSTEVATRSARLGRRDRGDVPGWVLITVMTAGLVTAIWVLARPALESMFTTALNGVKGP